MSPSKAFNLAGFQVAYLIIANQEYKNKYDAELKALDITVPNSFGVAALEAAYNESKQWLENLLSYLRDNIDLVRNFLHKNIPQIKFIEPQSTYLLWLDCRELGLNNAELSDFMIKKAHIGIALGEKFGVEGEGFVRLNVACPREILQEGLNRLARAVKLKESVRLG